VTRHEALRRRIAIAKYTRWLMVVLTALGALAAVVGSSWLGVLNLQSPDSTVLRIAFNNPVPLAMLMLGGVTFGIMTIIWNLEFEP